MKLSIIGTGYVGLTTGACLAKVGHQVICVDNDQRKIALLKEGKIPIYEPKLEEIVKEGMREGRLSFTTEIAEGVKNAQVCFIAVGTPPKETGEPDLSYVENVAREIGENMDDYRVIVEKSTVPVKTGKWVKTTIERYNRRKVPFDVASNPEFLREGQAVDDFLYPDRIVIGCESERAKEILLQIYQPVVAFSPEGKRPEILVTSLESAELIKHAANAFLAMKISFINAIACICELAGVDVKEVATGIGLDKRIGRDFLNPGIGYGGFCFPKDLDAFVKIAEELGYDFQLLREVKKINDDMRERFVRKVKDLLWNLRDKKIGVLGLAFKPNTDDMRFAPAITIIDRLAKEGAVIKVYDPKAMENAKKVLPPVIYCSSPYEVCADSECLLILTEWEEFKNLDLKRVKELLRLPIIIDGRNIFDPEVMRNLGFIYRGVGRGY
uniref:UDP-glucose 6-dehydrogenase n=1 Tax=candidate division WOR-3 bacterium TaxID=2052148 RepID=A0A7C3UPF9_UNCW3